MSNPNQTQVQLPVLVTEFQDISLDELSEEIYLSDLIAELSPAPYTHVPKPYTGSIGWDE